MPGYDMTGPMGRGQMSGRGMGYCARKFHPGMGRGMAYGMGKGRVLAFGTNLNSDEGDKEFLKVELSFLEEELKAVKEALARYETQED